MDSIKVIKNDIRLKLLEKRKNISEKSRKAAEEKITRSLTELASFRFCSTILLYSPFRGELDLLTPLIKLASEPQKRIALPISSKDTPEMSFFYISSKDELCKGTFGIMEPQADAEKYIPKKHDDAICIIPAIAYDKSGHRLGYGKGYYDRFLSEFYGTKIGVCMSDMLLGKLPHGKYDLPADVIITEKGVIIPNGQK